MMDRGTGRIFESYGSDDDDRFGGSPQGPGGYLIGLIIVAIIVLFFVVAFVVIMRGG